MSVRWVPDANEPTGGYFIDATGRRLPPAPVYNPDTGQWERQLEGGGTEPLGPPAPRDERFPVPAPAVETPAPAPTPAATPTPSGQDPLAKLLAEWTARYGAPIGPAFTIDPEIDIYDELHDKTRKGPNPNPTRRYTFPGGRVLEVTDKGEVRGTKEEEAGQPKENDTRESVREGRKVTETFKGGNWVVTSVGEPAVSGQPKENDTRQSVREGRNVTETFKGGSWVVTSVGAEAVPGEAKPKENDTRQSVREGRNVTETFKGGQWVVTSIGDSATPGQPKENDTRESVREGRNVTETYKGGQWVVTKIGDPAVPGQPKEGDKRGRVLEGRNVEESYEGGQWVVKSVGGRAVPEQPQAVTGSADSPFILSRDPETGALKQEPNPNYRPKTPQDLQARMGQIQQLAQAKKQEVMAKYASDPEKGLAEFNKWWDDNVQTQMGTLQAQAEEINFARGKEIATMRQQALQQAQVAGSQAISAYQASGLSRVGGGMADALKKAGEGAGALKDIDWQRAVFVPTDDPGSVANRAKAATDAAYQGLVSGVPEYKPMAPGAELDRTKYTPTFAQQQAAAQAAPAPGGVQPAPNLFHATPIMTTPDGQTQWQYPAWSGGEMPPPPTPEMAEPMDGTFDYNALAQEQQTMIPYAPAARARAIQAAPLPTPVNRAQPFAEQALAAGLGTGGLAPPAPPPAAPGFGYDPSNISIDPVITAPGFGYDPSSFAQAYTPPTPEMITPPEYNPSPYQFPGQEFLMNAARNAYRAVPRTRWQR